VTDQREGAIYGLLAGIGFIAVVMVLAFAVCVSNAGANSPYRRDRRQPSCDQSYDDGGGRNCNDGTQGGGNGNKGRDGDTQRGDKNCHSLCGNTIIVPSPGETTTTTVMAGETPRRAVVCVLALPYHCDEEPSR
jgi:hypothetical protein